MKIERILIDLMREPDSVASSELSSLTVDECATLFALASEYRCGPYLAMALSKRPDFKVPPSLLSIRNQSLFRNLNVERECLRIHRILANAGIRHLFLKGIPLAFRDYPKPWMRPMRDIDVLVDPNRADEAYELLTRAGGAMDEFEHMQVNMVEGRKHFPPINSPKQILPVELHYRVVSSNLSLSPQALSVIEREIWNSPATFKIGEVLLPTPSVEMLLVHLLVHGMYDHELNNGPLFFTDLIHLIRSNVIDEARFHDLVRQIGILPAVGLAASLLPPTERRVLCPGNTQVDLLSRDALTLLLLQSSSQRTELKLMATLSASTLRGRITLLARKLFPDASTLRTRWHMQGGKAGSEPRNPVIMWFWFVISRGRSFQRLKSKASRTAQNNLLALRLALANQTDGSRKNEK